MCQHRGILINNYLQVCELCGLLLGRELDCSEVSYFHKNNICAPKYCRLTRLKRLLTSLRGHHQVDTDLMKTIEKLNPSCPRDLRRKLKSSNNSEMTCKLISIYRQLGFKVPHLTRREEHLMIEVFKKIDIKKLSFQIIIPFLLYTVERLQAFVKYLKPLSMNLKNKHLPVLATSLKHTMYEQYTTHFDEIFSY